MLETFTSVPEFVPYDPAGEFNRTAAPQGVGPMPQENVYGPVEPRNELGAVMNDGDPDREAAGNPGDPTREAPEQYGGREVPVSELPDSDPDDPANPNR